MNSSSPPGGEKSIPIFRLHLIPDRAQYIYVVGEVPEKLLQPILVHRCLDAVIMPERQML